MLLREELLLLKETFAAKYGHADTTESEASIEEACAMVGHEACVTWRCSICHRTSLSYSRVDQERLVVEVRPDLPMLL